MNYIRWILTLSIIPMVCLPAFSQNAIGDWSDHISYSESRAIAIGGSRVFVSNSEGIFYYNRKDNSVSRLSQVQGLTDRGINAIAWNEMEELLVIGYDNGNIDLWNDGSVYNMPDLLNSSVLGSKQINRIVCREQYAYLCTGVGVLEIDLERREVSSTYNIAFPGESLILNDIEFLGDSVYVAANDGLYTASMNASNLGNFELWSKVAVPEGRYIEVESNIEGLYTIYRNVGVIDSLGYRDPGNGWQFVLSSPDSRGLLSTGNGMLFLESYGVRIFEEGVQTGEFAPSAIEQRNFFDLGTTGDGIYWLADNDLGLIEFTFEGEVRNITLPEGPHSKRVFEIEFNEGDLWMVTGRANRPGNWNSNFIQDGFAHFRDGNWKSFNWSNSPVLKNDTVLDLVDVAINPQNKNHAFMGSWYAGLVEYEDGQVVQVYDYSNSILAEWLDFEGWCGVSDVEFDENGNLWMINGMVQNPLVVFTAGGEWENFNFDGVLGSSRLITDMIINQNGDIWAVYNEIGLLAYSTNSTPLQDSDDQGRLLTSQTGNGGLHSIDILCIEEDLDGEIWVGTSEGITVFYTPSDVFAANPSDAQRIIIEEGGTFRYLLETEAISSIAVDGANRKWIGTFGSGAFLISEDGKEQVLHFTTDNSPLPSNSVEDIEIDPETGEVYLGTSNGIVSYRGDATASEQQNTCANVYPNPVRENYDGPIAIEGLVRDAVVKITDVRGNLVKELTSNGGQAVWDGTNVDGQQVHTGVYFALASSSLAETTCISKILVVK